jgi:CheY-like chemotaxis protein
MELPKTVLVVDDEASFREIFSLKLTAAGYHVETASSGDEGIKKVKELRPDLVLLDIRMPGMTGEEVLATLRRDPLTSFTKIIFTTSIGDPSDIETDKALAEKFGADGYINKTEDLENFVTLVNGYSGASKIEP